MYTPALEENEVARSLAVAVFYAPAVSQATPKLIPKPSHVPSNALPGTAVAPVVLVDRNSLAIISQPSVKHAVVAEPTSNQALSRIKLPGAPLRPGNVVDSNSIAVVSQPLVKHASKSTRKQTISSHKLDDSPVGPVSAVDRDSLGIRLMPSFKHFIASKPTPKKTITSREFADAQVGQESAVDSNCCLTFRQQPLAKDFAADMPTLINTLASCELTDAPLGPASSVDSDPVDSNVTEMEGANEEIVERHEKAEKLRAIMAAIKLQNSYRSLLARRAILAARMKVLDNASTVAVQALLKKSIDGSNASSLVEELFVKCVHAHIFYPLW
jgi:hypothetical protein